MPCAQCFNTQMHHAIIVSNFRLMVSVNPYHKNTIKETYLQNKIISFCSGSISGGWQSAPALTATNQRVHRDKQFLPRALQPADFIRTPIWALAGTHSSEAEHRRRAAPG